MTALIHQLRFLFLIAALAILHTGCTSTKVIARNAANGNAQAQFEYGRRLLTGSRAPKSPERALVWFHSAAMLGHSKAMVAIGYCHERGLGTAPDPKLAREWYQRATDAGDNDALRAIVGMDMRSGNTAQAMEGIAKLSRRRDPKATAMLIRRYMNPDSPDYNPAKGIEYVRYAALDGSREAALMLSYCYANGIGVPKNPVLAESWRTWKL